MGELTVRRPRPSGGGRNLLAAPLLAARVKPRVVEGARRVTPDRVRDARERGAHLLDVLLTEEERESARALARSWRWVVEALDPATFLAWVAEGNLPLARLLQENPAWAAWYVEEFARAKAALLG